MRKENRWHENGGKSSNLYTLLLNYMNDASITDYATIENQPFEAIKNEVTVEIFEKKAAILEAEIIDFSFEQSLEGVSDIAESQL